MELDGGEDEFTADLTMALQALCINSKLLQEVCYVCYFCLVCQFTKIPSGLIMVTLHSEINKQESQLCLRTHKSKLFSTFVLVKRKKMIQAIFVKVFSYC